MAARLNLSEANGGAGALARARKRAASACLDEITHDTAAGLARVSPSTILRAWKRGDLQPVNVKEDGRRATFSAEAVRAWARAKRLIL
jgi:hypothetical protein